MFRKNCKAHFFVKVVYLISNKYKYIYFSDFCLIFICMFCFSIFKAHCFLYFLMSFVFVVGFDVFFFCAVAIFGPSSRCMFLLRHLLLT